jgi:GTP:adenosylcobinamide-phosphate guanylyltransferase
MKINVVILAGAPAGAEMVSEGENISRAMIKLGDKTMLAWVVDALKGASSVGKIVAVGDVAADGIDQIIKPGESLIENIKRGIDALGDCDNVLIVTSDIPLLTPEAVDDFIERAVPLDADLAYPIITKESCDERYPEFKRTYLKTAEGMFTGGNIMLVRPDFVEKNWQAIMNAYSARKKVVQLARMIGIGALIRVLVAQFVPQVLKITLLEKAAGRMLDAKVAAVISSYPEIGEDVDKASDVEAMRKIMN